MLLNKIPTLDKGYVAFISSSCNFDKCNEVAMEFFKRDDSQFLKELSTLTLAIKCPLFLQLNLSTHGFKIISAPPSEEVEAYLPNEGEIGSPDLGTNRDIVSNIKASTEALLINPKAFQYDGCDRFISQILTPLNTYTTLIVHGSYNDWKRFCNQQKVPGPTKSYIKAITQIVNAEWRG
jgi:hypothetical protein